ncbi:hypothetical protein HJC10_11565 [Corallococcus exiguus]|uniref:hypothetical protein n=1 Tax=Corallococcus TaxID=83461 RepID=UPI000EEF1803|nr:MULTISPECIES: hypothetical protein [Corallococcus]NNB92000.1 hypothetical protein [Corallococcus exiguus]NNB95479.1 hypothetical protein [Corallococcus exiguus]NNC03478.1 hypothetical protein [Corallococcus exiguus]NPC53253.1 hypothetical protein [Corallococcus exiguus]RKH76492.1 hypothetical protein D7X99_34745 [Corallococcus sp. AB032C]
MTAMERYTGTPKLMVPAFGLGVVGLVLTAVGFFMNPEATSFSYLLGFTYWVGISVSALIMLAIFHTAKAKWPIVLRRAMETMSIAVPVFAVLILAFIPMMKHMYPWVDGSPLAAHIHGIEVEHLSHKKAHYLNGTFFFVRQVIYFAVWIFVSHRLYGWSTQQDEVGGLELTVKQRRFSPGALPFLALTITFASFDWLMSLTPLWQSTIFGVYYFAGSFLAAFCVLTLATIRAQGKDLYGSLVKTPHYHNLGKLIFAFTAFWAYIGFSQFLLVWIANIPEEAPWYGLRMYGPWRGVSLVIFFGHFVLPFFTLLSRKLKEKTGTLAVAALYMLLMHAVDLYWLIWPAFSGEAGPTFHWTLITAFVGVGGVSVGYALYRARNKYTFPVKDPYIAESLRYVQP